MGKVKGHQESLTLADDVLRAYTAPPHVSSHTKGTQYGIEPRLDPDIYIPVPALMSTGKVTFDNLTSGTLLFYLLKVGNNSLKLRGI